MPIVPAVAVTACVLGKKPRSRWYPANLLKEALGVGAGPMTGEQLIRSLGTALAVDDGDDLFARFLSVALDASFPAAPAVPPFAGLSLSDEELHAFRGRLPPNIRMAPAERFCLDLPFVLQLKPLLTRRQWTVLVEALLRLGLGMHVLWICQANVLAWELVLATAGGQQIPTATEIESLIWESHCDRHPLLEIGQNSEPALKQLIQRYAYARLGLNLLFCRLEEIGAAWDSKVAIGFSRHVATTTAFSIRTFLQHVEAHRGSIDANAAGWLRNESRN